MAENSEYYFVKIDALHKTYLGQIRHWENLEIGKAANYIWIKGFTEAQINATSFKSIPFTTVFSYKNHLLFPIGRLLPALQAPNLDWLPIQQALKIELPNYNHGFFGINTSVPVKLVPTDKEEKATVLLVQSQEVSDYITKSPAFRLNPLTWVLVNNEKALIFGTPMLPINGISYWIKGNFILPSGFDLAFLALRSIIEQKLNPQQTHWIWWTSAEDYCLIDKKLLNPLSITSWKETFNIR
jgi:MoxR-vWA-beta-propeller ternary system domain bpX2